MQAKKLNKTRVKEFNKLGAKQLNKPWSIKLNKLQANKSKWARNQISYIPHFKAHLDNLPKLLTTLLGTYPPRNMMTQQLAQVLLLTEIWGSVKLLVGIDHPYRTHRENQNDPTMQPTIIHSNQSTVWIHSDQDYSPLGILDSGTDVRSLGSGQNIDNCTRVNPQGPVRTRIPDTNSESNCDIF